MSAHRLIVPALLAMAGGMAAAEGLNGSIGLSSDRVERGVSQSSGQVSASADLGYVSRWGALAGLGLATVDPDQFGGASLQWSPRLGWAGSFAGERGTWSVGWSGHYFPGATGQRSAPLPPRASSGSGVQAQVSDFATAELNLALGWQGLGLTLDRALTDYYGIGEDGTQTGPLGQRVKTKVADSTGSWHVGLRYEHAFESPSARAWIGVGRQVVRNFEQLNYNDWSMGTSLSRWGLVWSLEATGTNASRDYWQVRRSGGDTRQLASRRVSARVAWEW